MAVSKITEKQITDNGVVSAADVLTGSIPENKSVFDKLPRFIITVLNGLIDKFNDSESSKITDVRVNGVSKVTNNIANITVDSDVSDVSENPISNKAAKAYADKLKWASATVPVDDALSDTSINPVQNKVVTNKFTEVDSAISSVSAKAMTNLDRTEERINQNINNLQNALNAEVTNRESAVTSLGNSVSENTNKINSVLGTIGGISVYSMIDGAISLVKRSNIVLVSANFTKAQAMMFFTRDAAGDGVVVPDKYKPYYNAAYFPIVYNLAGNKIGYGAIQYNTGRIKFFLESGANINNIDGIAFSVAYPSLN